MYSVRYKACDLTVPRHVARTRHAGPQFVQECRAKAAPIGQGVTLAGVTIYLTDRSVDNRAEPC